jgi:hypothetical protein
MEERMLLRCLLTAAAVLLAAAPAGVGVGVWLAVSVGWGVFAGSVGFGALAVFVLTADLLSDRRPVPPAEVIR